MRASLPSSLFLSLGSLALASLFAGAACGNNETFSDPNLPYEAGAPAPLACVPNLDGKIDSNEIQPAIGIPLSYFVSPPGVTRTVDVAGATDAQGHLTWDFSVDYANDEIATISAQALAGKWYAASFPANAFVVPQDAGDTIEGVITYDTTGYHLLGLASTAQNPAEGQTLYVYDTPVDVYRFPLAPGLTYTSVGTVKNAMLRGLPYAGTDTYVVTVDNAGTLLLQDYTFTQAMRVRTDLTAAPSAGETVTTKQVSFLFECFGEVARATSQNNETQENFTTAAEVRRLGNIP